MGSLEQNPAAIQVQRVKDREASAGPPRLDDRLERVLICGRPSKCKRFLKKIGT